MCTTLLSQVEARGAHQDRRGVLRVASMRSNYSQLSIGNCYCSTFGKFDYGLRTQIPFHLERSKALAHVKFWQLEARDTRQDGLHATAVSIGYAPEARRTRVSP